MERGMSRRRLISLICAGWVPHDNLFIGDSASLRTWIEPRFAIKAFRAYPFIVTIPLPIAPLSSLLKILKRSHSVVILCHHAPHESRELTRDCRRGGFRILPGAHKTSMLGLESSECPIGVIDNQFAATGSPRLQHSAGRTVLAIVPTRLDKQVAQMGVPCLRYASLSSRAAA